MLFKISQTCNFTYRRLCVCHAEQQLRQNMSSVRPPWIQESANPSPRTMGTNLGLFSWSRPTNSLCWVPGLCVCFTHPSSLLRGVACCWRGRGDRRHSFLMTRLNLSFCWSHNALESDCSSLLGPDTTHNKASFLLMSLLTFISLLAAVSTWQPRSVPWPCNIAAEVARSDWEVCWWGTGSAKACRVWVFLRGHVLYPSVGYCARVSCSHQRRSHPLW